MFMREINNLHCEQLERILFTSEEGTPFWLKEAPRKCKDRYKNIQLTDRFKTAINAFDDEGTPKPFELFILGEGKFGKSTIVNCLLGEELSKVQGLPETRCFHRYIFKNDTSEHTKLFIRRKPQMHDWLVSRLGKGQPVSELFEILQYQTTHHVARELIHEDVSKQEYSGYEQAIYEIERDVKKNELSPFQREIRVVDTQGLDQLFPDDLKSAIKSNLVSSRESCYNWIRETPRGLHLDWQFRRCDAVLWCINAKRLGSAATLEYLEYFSNYSKKIVIALTHIDIARNDRERDRLMAKAHELYDRFSDAIIPVNGKAAWDGIKNLDRSKYAGSGMQNLVNILIDICDKDGKRVRNVSRYKGLRQTEKQYRNALDILRKDYIALEKKYSEDLTLVKFNQNHTKERLLKFARGRGQKMLSEILQGVPLITIKDNIDEAENKLKINSKSRIYKDYLFSILERALLPELSSLNDKITPYQLPKFDADGERAGTAISRQVATLNIKFALSIPTPKLQLGSLWDKIANKYDSFLSFFGSDEAKRRKEQRLINLHNAVRKKIEETWADFLREIDKKLSRENDIQYDNITKSIQKIMNRIMEDAGDTLPQAIRNIDDALSGLAVPNVVISKMLSFFKNEIIMKDSTIYSIGHGEKEIDEFIAELKKFKIQYLLDIRSKPFSRCSPQFNHAELKCSLDEQKIKYVFMGDTLGGLPSERSCYNKDGNIMYNLVKEKVFFKTGLQRLVTANEKKIVIAIMCSDTEPEECHRSKLIGAELFKINIPIKHIVSGGSITTQVDVTNIRTSGRI